MRETARARPSARSTSAAFVSSVVSSVVSLLFLPSPRRSRERLMRRRRSRVVGVHLHRRQRLERRRRLHRPELVDGRRDHPHQQDVPFVSENPQRRAEPIVAMSRRSQAHVDEPVRGGGDVDGSPLALHGHRVAIVFRVIAVVVLEGHDLPRVLVRAADEREEGLGSSRVLDDEVVVDALGVPGGARGVAAASDPSVPARERARRVGAVVATPALAFAVPHPRAPHVRPRGRIGRGREEPRRGRRARRSRTPSDVEPLERVSGARYGAGMRVHDAGDGARELPRAPSQHGPDARGEQWRALPGNPP